MKVLGGQLLDALTLLVGQRHGRPHQHADALVELVAQFAVHGRDRPEDLQPVMFVEHQQEVDEQVFRLAAEDALDIFGLAVEMMRRDTLMRDPSPFFSPAEHLSRGLRISDLGLETPEELVQ